MKTQLLSLAMLTISALGYSQSQNWWRVNGNTPSNSDFLGTTNSAPLVFKTNNTTRFTLDATGNAIFNGNITAAGGINLGDGLGLKSYTSSNPLVGKIIVVGAGVNTPPGNNNQDDPPACVVSTGANPNVTGWLAGINQGYYSSATLNGNNSFLTMYSNINNGNGYIDISGSNNSGGTPELFINNNCGRNTRINWLNGSVFMGQYVFMKNNLEIGDPTNGMVTGTGVLLNIKNSIGFHANIIGNASQAAIDAFRVSKGSNTHFNVNGEGQTLINSLNSDALIVKNNSNSQDGFTIKNNGSAIINTYANSPTSIFTVKNMNLSATPNPWNNNVFEVQADGKTFIGNQRQNTGPHTDALLHVNGKMAAQSCYIRIVQWADYVFAKDYKVPSLYDVEKYYLANKHLPEVPTEKEVAENGIEVGEMNTILLKKIEEMTIQMVQMKKEIDNLKSQTK
jgi:hypothetical protein